jgi:hypothetical protein
MHHCAARVTPKVEENERMDEPKDARRRRLRPRFVVGVIVALYVGLGALFLIVWLLRDQFNPTRVSTPRQAIGS